MRSRDGRGVPASRCAVRVVNGTGRAEILRRQRGASSQNGEPSSPAGRVLSGRKRSWYSAGTLTGENTTIIPVPDNSPRECCWKVRSPPSAALSLIGTGFSSPDNRIARGWVTETAPRRLHQDHRLRLGTGRQVSNTIPGERISCVLNGHGAGTLGSSVSG